MLGSGPLGPLGVMRAGARMLLLGGIVGIVVSRLILGVEREVGVVVMNVFAVALCEMRRNACLVHDVGFERSHATWNSRATRCSTFHCGTFLDRELQITTMSSALLFGS